MIQLEEQGTSPYLRLEVKVAAAQAEIVLGKVSQSLRAPSLCELASRLRVWHVAHAVGTAGTALLLVPAQMPTT